MCSACGVLQDGPEWFDGVGSCRPPLAEQQKRLRLINRLLAPGGTSASEFGGKLILRNQTGMTRLVPDMAHLWTAAGEIGRRAVDPLAGFEEDCER